MEEKNWFIINKDHHQGPFCSNDIENFFDLGKIDQNTMIWKESLENWVSLKDSRDFSELFLPDFPPIPTPDKLDFTKDVGRADTPPEIPLKVKIETRKVILERPEVNRNTFDRIAIREHVRLEKIEIEKDVRAEVNSISMSEVVDIVEEKPLSFMSNIQKSLKLTLGGLTLISIFTLTYYLTNNTKKNPKFSSLKREEFKRLKEHTKTGFNGKLNLDFAFSKEGDILWASSNLLGPATMFLNLKSVEGRVISNEQIEANSKALLNERAVKFKNFNFKEGSKLPLGEYNAEVVAIKTGLKTKVHNFSKGRKPTSKKIIYSGKVTRYGQSKLKFEKRLKKFKLNEKLKLNLPLQDRIEKYRTLGALVDRIGRIYGKTLNKTTKPGKMRGFEREYGMSVGPILQGIILDNHEQARKLRRTNPTRAKKYIKLLDYGKRIGELASDMVTVTSKFKRLSRSKKAHLLLLFQKKVEDLRSLARMRLSKLSSQVN